MAKLTLCVSIMLVLLAALGDSSPMRFCCTQYQQDPVPVRALRYYVMFKTKKNKIICADPERPWVKHAMELVPKKP